MSEGDSILKQFEDFLMEYDIKSTPQDIKLAECENRAFVAMAKRMLEAQKLEKSFWAEVVANVIYILNRYPTRALHSSL